MICDILIYDRCDNKRRLKKKCGVRRVSALFVCLSFLFQVYVFCYNLRPDTYIAVCSQQRIFLMQVFELHRLIKVIIDLCVPDFHSDYDMRSN